MTTRTAGTIDQARDRGGFQPRERRAELLRDPRADDARGDTARRDVGRAKLDLLERRSRAMIRP